MPYHSGKKTKTKKTKQKKGQKKNSPVTIVQNNAGKFVQQAVVNIQEEQEDQINLIQQTTATDASAESLFQEEQTTEQKESEETSIELNGTLVMPSPASNTWVVQTINNNNLIQQVESGTTITLIQQGSSQDYIIQSVSGGNKIILTDSVSNQSIGSTLEFSVTFEPPQETQEEEEEEPPQLPAPPFPPDDPRVEITQRFYPGINFRTFYGLESYRDILEDFVQENNIDLTEWEDYWPSNPSDYQSEVPVASQTREYLFNTVFENLPLIKISVLKEDGTTGKFYRIADEEGGGDSIPIPTPTNSSERLNVIQSGFTYVVEMGGGQPYYDVTYRGLEPPFTPRRYETQPFEEVPASLPDAYQNRYINEWEEFEDIDIPTTQFCATCNFYEPDGSYCNKWNAQVRLNYWCASWQQLIYPEAQSNEFTQFLRQKDASNAHNNMSVYNFFHDRVKFPATPPYPQELHGEPNLNNFLAPFNALFSTYGAVLVGDYLRRVVDSGNAYDYDDSDLEFIFPTPGLLLSAIDFINNDGLRNFGREGSPKDLVVQAKTRYTLILESGTELGNYYPNQVKISLLGSWFGEVKNVISQMLFTNVKYAYTPKFNNTSSHSVWFDVRTTPLRGNGVFNIDILKQNLMERFIKLANDPTQEKKLNRGSSFNFLSWVAARAPHHWRMQELYNVMLNSDEFSVDNEAFMAALNNCLHIQFPDDPEPANMPLTANMTPTQPPYNFWERDSEQNGNGSEAGSEAGNGDSSGEEDSGGY